MKQEEHIKYIAKQCKKMESGDLYQKYEELKAKLEKERLFSSGHKKKIPVMPKTIGVLSSRYRGSNKRYNKCFN